MTAAVACAAALLLAACSSSDDGAATDSAAAGATPAAGTTPASAATTAPSAATAGSSSPQATEDHDHADHDHSADDHSDHDHPADGSATGAPDDHDHTPAEIPLDAATVQWYESFCSVVEGVALQSGANYTVQSPPEEIRRAHVDWLTGVETEATTHLATMEAAGTPGLDDGANLQADLLVTLTALQDGAGASADLFGSAVAIDGVEPTDPAWLEKALVPYTEGVEPFHDYLSANENALMPGEHELQIASIGVCSKVLHVH